MPNAAIPLNAQTSLFTDTYQWTLLPSPSGANATISTTNNMHIDFGAGTDGEFVPQFNASSLESSSSDNDQMTVVVDNTLAKAPGNLRFHTGITTEPANSATSCHENSAIAGMPMWWVDDASQSQGILASTADTPALAFYEQAVARVNFECAEDCLISKKPGGRHHYDGQRPGFDRSQVVESNARTTYGLFVNWISEADVCGGTSNQCPR